GIFGVNPGATVAISDLTLANATGTAVSNHGSLTLERVVIENNHASGPSTFSAFGSPGGIYNDGALNIQDSTIANNSTANTAVAAGLDSEGGSVTITDSTITGNVSNQTNSTGGIGIYGGSLVIDNSTVTRNVADNSSPNT